MSLSLTELRDSLSLLLLSQSPHLPTNVTEIKLTDGYRTVELSGIDQAEINDLAEDLASATLRANLYEDECGDLNEEVRDLQVELKGRDSEIVRLQADLIELGLQLNAVLSR